MTSRSLFLLRSAAVAAALLTTSRSQETVEQRLDRLERENRDLRLRVDAIAPPAAGAADPRGTATGFRKAYAPGDGVSLAGYGEALWTQNSGRTDVADALRTVLYVGYRFDERWLVHSEIELEHGTTSDASGTTSSGGEVSLEFGYLECQASDVFALRTGMVLMPVGLVNEAHEPTMFLPAARAQTETRILPTTWRELGVQAIARLGDVEGELFVGTGLDGEEFGPAGLRAGRQKGNRAAADDVAAAFAVTWRPGSEWSLGASTVYQQAGQDGLRGSTRIPDLDTWIAEAHAEWRPGAWTLRALYATAISDDAEAFAAATGRNLAERMHGAYGEVGYDVAPWLLPQSRVVVTPFVRHERIDTQAQLAPGLVADGAFASTITTFGIAVKPIESIVFKVDFESWSDQADRFNLAMGYVF